MSAVVTSLPVSVDPDRAAKARANLEKLMAVSPTPIRRVDPASLFSICSCCGAQTMGLDRKMHFYGPGGILIASRLDEESLKTELRDVVLSNFERFGYSSADQAKTHYVGSQSFMDYLYHMRRINKRGVTLSWTNPKETIEEIFPDGKLKGAFYEFNDEDDPGVCLVWSDE